MQVSVNTKTGKTITLELDDTDGVMEISVKNNKNLKITTLAFEHYDGIDNVKFNLDDNVNMFVSLRQMLQIFVKLINGNAKVSVEVERSDTVEKVKMKMVEYMGSVSPYWYKLVFNGTYLEDFRTIEYYSIQQGSCLGLRLFMQIFVKIECGKTITVEVESTETIGNLKEKIKKKVRFPPIGGYMLLYNGKCLEDVHTLIFYNVRKDSTLHLVLRHPS